MSGLKLVLGRVADLYDATDEKLRLLSPIVAAYVSAHTFRV